MPDLHELYDLPPNREQRDEEGNYITISLDNTGMSSTNNAIEPIPLTRYAYYLFEQNIITASPVSDVGRYSINDVVVFAETHDDLEGKHKGYTGRFLKRRISHILTDHKAIKEGCGVVCLVPLQ